MGSSDKKGTMKHLNFLIAFMNSIKKLLRKLKTFFLVIYLLR